MKFVSLFAGIGGFDLGLERAGHECVGQVEINPFAIKVLEKHWPNVPRIRDVKEYQGHEFGSFDMLVGGYPCQPFSIAGNQRGEHDERHLWPEVHRIIRNVRPRFVLLENVPGHLSLGFGRVLGDLAESGYDAEWDCIPAAAVGAPHRRDRLFVFAHANKSRLERSVQRAERSLFKANDVLAQQAREPWPDFVSQPIVRRGDDGFSNRVDRLRTLGNAVVPQVAEWIGQQLNTRKEQ